MDIGTLLVGFIGFMLFLSFFLLLQGAALHVTGNELLRAGRELEKKFNELGEPTGKSKNYIIKIVGQPTSISAIEGGKSLLQWQRQGFHIALIFDKDMCEVLSSKTVHRG